MATINSATRVNCGPPGTCDTQTPCCPNCGAVECLCRPRFFAGQLLSEQDLNRLDQYIKNKNRLHNRNQHGWGVVNGLLVLCDPCGEVKVTEGYAVDPCGDDIVVCEDTRVNICELIRKCKQAEPQPECQPFHQPPNASCNDIEEQWVLTIKYREWASRGVTALRGNTCSTSGCTCGAASNSATACSCGANGATSSSYHSTSSSVARKNRAAPQQCEPTVTCEGYSFDVYKKPQPENEDDDDDRLFQLDGAFWDAFNCCAQPLMDAIPPMPDLSSDDNLLELANAITRWCCQFRENLLNYFLTHRNTSCEIIEHLRAVNCPNINSPNTFVYDFINSFLQLLAAWAEGIKNCLCLSLLPPPPQATCDVRVPLATVRIRARDCSILSICNWTQERKIMITWPSMSHWLGIVPIGDFIRELLERMCCDSLLDIFDDVLQRLPERDPQGIIGSDVAGVASAETFAAAPAAGDTISFSQSMHLASGSMASRFGTDLSTKMNSFSTLVDSVIARGDEPVELGALLNSASPRFKLPDNGKKLNNVEAKNLPMLLMSEVMVKPVLSSFLGSGKAADRVSEFQQSLGKTKAKATATSGDASTAGLQQQMDDMRVQMQQQEAQIKKLLNKLDK